VVAILVMAAAAAAPASASPASPAFEPRDVDLATRLLFDLGVTDLDADDDLDVFTLNHNDRQSLLANRGDGSFADRLTPAGLDQTPAFPGFEVPGPPNLAGDGIYIYRTPGSDAAEGALRVAVRADPGEEASGRIGFLFPVAVNRDDGADVSIDFDRGQTPPRYVARFGTEGDALIELEPEQMAAPVEVAIGGEVPPSRVHVGPFAVPATSSRFTLTLRDRHGMAWADYNRDGAPDVFVTRGGLKRRVGEFAGLIFDELMVGGPTGFRDATDAAEIVKGTCRGREASPVDFNRDGLLDVFYGCQSSNPALWAQNEDGTFTNRSAKLVRAGVSGQHFRWLDVDGDGADELLAARRERLIAFERKRRGRWKRHQRAIRTQGQPLGRPAVADFDDDRDPDLFVASPAGNTLVLNDHGKLRARAPGRFGLPKHGSFTASWIDYDNDGRTDLYTAPQGIFRRVGERRFKRTGLAASPPGALDAFASWFDFNADGARDAVLAAAAPDFRAALLENLERERHWLQVELDGEGGAYPALGARVRVRSGGRVQTQWVGQSDGSRYSLGHYRLYFGLGDEDEAREVKVLWPDGTRRVLDDVRADRLVRVSFERR
jgi:ASPIC and UnbV/FG-GAP-like repeat